MVKFSQIVEVIHKKRKRMNSEKHKIPFPHKLSCINRSGGHKIALLPCITCTQGEG